MTIQKCIQRVDALKPNTYTNDEKVLWLNECEGDVQLNIFLIAHNSLVEYTDYETDKNKELLVRSPYDRLYIQYLIGKIDFANGEYTAYANDVNEYNSTFSSFSKWISLRIAPADRKAMFRGYYLVGPQGAPFTVIGLVASTSDLPETGEAGEAYAVGTDEVNAIYIWDTHIVTNGWISIGPMKGDKGDTGDQGPQGVGIVSIEKTSTSGNYSTYTITYTDGNSDTFTIYSAQAAAAAAEGSAEAAEAWATGGTSGTPSATNNAKYYSEQAADEAVSAGGSAAAADTSAQAAEAWATGGSSGTPSASNNAKHYSEVAEAAAASITVDPTLSIAGKAADAKAAGDGLAEKANFDCYYEEMAVGNAEQLIGNGRIENKTPYVFRTTCDSEDVGNRLEESIVGGSIAWNQLVNTTDTSVTIPSGDKYIAYLGGEWFMDTSDGTAIPVSGAGGDMLFNITWMFGILVANVFTIDMFRAMFPLTNYAYNAGTILSVKTSAHKTVGFNAYNNATGTAKLIGGRAYQITGAYTELSYSTGETIEPDVDGIFIPTDNGTLTVTGGEEETTCVHLVWSGQRNGDFEEYREHTYPLDDSMELRGIFRLDANNSLYCDGDVYEPDGIVTRNYVEVDLGSINWSYSSDNQYFYGNIGGDDRRLFLVCDKFKYGGSNSNGTGMLNKPEKVLYQRYSSSHGYYTTIMIKDLQYTTSAAFKAAVTGVKVVCNRSSTITETAEPFARYQFVDDFGTEEYLPVSGASAPMLPVGHDSHYTMNLRDKLQRLPNAPSAAGDYLVHYDGLNMALTPLPAYPSEDGTYTLTATVAEGNVTLSWGS